MNLVQIGGVEQLVDVEKDEEIVSHAGKPVDVSATGGHDRVRRGLNLIGRHPHHAGDGVDVAAHRPLADIHDDRAGLGVDVPAFESEQDAEVDDRDDRSPEIAHAIHVTGHLGNPCDPCGDDDFLDPLDAERIFLAGKFEADELGSVGCRPGCPRMVFDCGVHAIDPALAPNTFENGDPRTRIAPAGFLAGGRAGLRRAERTPGARPFGTS
jgi:hypothetical protein